MGAARQHLNQHIVGNTVYGIVKDLRADADSLAFPIPIEGVAEALEAKTLLMAQLDDHLLPRLAELATPAVVVVAGSTGTGKSTIVNSLVQEELSPAGVIRPTTLAPVLVTHPDDLELMSKSPVAQGLDIHASTHIPQGIALLDAPDLDSIRDENRAEARRLLESADLWLFVTSAQRYGDALPWATLTSAVKRGTNVAMILNRVPDASRATVESDLRQRLETHGLGSSQMFVVADQGPHHGLIDPDSVAEIKAWLKQLAGTDKAEEIIVSTLKGALTALPPRLTELADATDAQVAAKKKIKVGARRLLVKTVQNIRLTVADSLLAQGAAKAAWSLFITQGRLEKVFDRNGYAKGNARLYRARTLAAEQSQPYFHGVLASAGIDTIAQSRATLKEGLQSLQGGQLIDLSSFPERQGDIDVVVSEWLSAVEDNTENFVDDNTTKQVQLAHKNVGSKALASIVVAATLGIKDAQALAVNLLGNEVEELVKVSRSELADHYDRLILGEYVHITDQLETLGLEEGASARIRVRLAELKDIRWRKKEGQSA